MKRRFNVGDWVNIVKDTTDPDSVIREWQVIFRMFQPFKISRVDEVFQTVKLEISDEIKTKIFSKVSSYNNEIHFDYLELHSKFESFYNEQV
jgi:hypothetical protein